MPLNYEPGAGRTAVMQATDKVMQRVQQIGLTARQRKLNWLFAWYTAAQYDSRKVEFDGKERLDPIEREAIITASYIPPGFYDVGQQYPLKFRRPLAPYNLARVIVDRFTELLFAENRIPRVRVLGDALTEDYLQAIIEETDFWGRMMQARKLGGAMGSVAMGFQFVEGRPQVEVHDPRWCFPDFEDRVSMKLNLIEKRWIYTKEERVPGGKTGWKWADVPYWYRRIIDKNRDILFKPVKVDKGDEPLWEVDTERTVMHNLGFCPVVWIQNHEVPDDIDGESDCHGTYDQIEQMDLLTSMAVRGVVLNCFGVETEFVTAQGLRRFSDFKDGDECIVLTHANCWERAVVHSYGEQPLYNITFARSDINALVIRATKDHTWLLEDGSRTTSLKVGDRLLKPRVFDTDDPFIVMSIEEDRPEVVWCLSVAVDHSFVLSNQLLSGNCDPTVVVKGDFELQSIAKGSDNTVKLPGGGDFSYVEISGSGPKAAREVAAELRTAILEVAQVHLPPADGGEVQQTLGQVERTFSSMLAKASLLRRQYGKAATHILKMILRAAQRMQQGHRDETGMLIRRVLKLPPRVVEKEDGKVEITPRKLGGGGHLRLLWPKFFDYTLDDVQKATTAAGDAKREGLIDAKTASEFIAPMFHVDNVVAMLDKMKAEAAEANAAMEGGGGEEGYPPEEEGGAPAGEEAPAEGEQYPPEGEEPEEGGAPPEGEEPPPEE